MCQEHLDPELKPTMKYSIHAIKNAHNKVGTTVNSNSLKVSTIILCKPGANIFFLTLENSLWKLMYMFYITQLL